MSVIKLIPELKQQIWGGTRLRRDLGKQTDLQNIAESWELACREDGSCRTENGCTLWEYIQKQNKDVLGTSCSGCREFPLLIKLIDAEKDLSVQVHPNSEYALAHAGQGKTEMWYIADCAPDSSIILGFKEQVTKQQFAQAIEQGTLLELVNRIKVKKGDAFFVPPGTLHAIGKGILIAEIQQNSNTTYRVYDYGRLGSDGKPRELHIDKALDVTLTVPPPRTQSFDAVKTDGFDYRVLVRCEYFTVVKVDVESSAYIYIDDRSFAHLMLLEGSADIGGCKGKKGDSFFIDAASGEIQISGKCSFILTRNGCEERTDTLVKE